MKAEHILFATLGLALAAGACALVPARHTDRHTDKLWLHRCNSVEKYAEMHPRYPNVEIDVVFRPDGYFDVLTLTMRHPTRECHVQEPPTMA